ncbi:hypothetical protein YC2023_014675 [Brassica napus]
MCKRLVLRFTQDWVRPQPPLSRNLKSLLVMNQRTLLSRITPLTKVQGSTVFRQGSSLPSVSTGALRSKKRDRKRPPAWVRRTMANTKLNSLPVENTATSLSSDSTGKRKAENPTNSSADKSTKTQNTPTISFKLEAIEGWSLNHTALQCNSVAVAIATSVTTGQRYQSYVAAKGPAWLSRSLSTEAAPGFLKTSVVGGFPQLRPLKLCSQNFSRRSYGSGYIAPFSEIIIPNPKRRLDLFLDSLPLPQLIPHNASDESSGTSMYSHKSSIQDPYRPSTSPFRLDAI